MLFHCNRIRRQRGNNGVLDIEEDGCDPLRVEDLWPSRGDDPGSFREQESPSSSPGHGRTRVMNANESTPFESVSNAILPVRNDPNGAGATGPSSGAVTVLVATARQSLVRAFQRAAVVVGLTLVVSPDGLHTLMSAVREPPALIILDPDVPGIEADTVQRRLARDARTAGIPVLRLPSHVMGDRASGLPDDHAA
jgi:CheY-like chemotaxis protein